LFLFSNPDFGPSGISFVTRFYIIQLRKTVKGITLWFEVARSWLSKTAGHPEPGHGKRSGQDGIKMLNRILEDTEELAEYEQRYRETVNALADRRPSELG
jgi:hypothetical protein